MIHTPYNLNKILVNPNGDNAKPTAIRIPDMMNAVRYLLAIGPAGLAYEPVETPQVKAGHVLVRVYSASITRDELEWPVDRLPAIPSYEFSGVVSAIGSDVPDVTVGDQVYALAPFDMDGAAAEYILISKEFLAPRPANLDHIHSAAIPLSALTAWQGLFEHGQLTRGQRVLIHGAAGGVGSMAVQLARHQGAYVIGTVSTAHMQRARELGLDEVIDHTTTRFEDAAGQVDLVFDTVGGDRLARSANVLRPGGRLVSVASEPSQELAAQRGIQAVYFVVRPDGKQLVEITKLVNTGILYPDVDKSYSLANARHAFERSLAPHPSGKIVLCVCEELADLYDI